MLIRNEPHEHTVPSIGLTAKKALGPSPPRRALLPDSLPVATTGLWTREDEGTEPPTVQYLPLLDREGERRRGEERAEEGRVGYVLPMLNLYLFLCS
jgi:hypothetical protein